MSIIENESVITDLSSPVARLTIARPENLNALTPDVLQSLIIAFDKISKDPKISVVIITGAGAKAFVAGADIRTMHDLGPRAIADYVELGQRAMRTIELAAPPVIAAVNGYALGGGMELALACDVIVASDKAKLGQPEVNLGILPGFGGTQRLIHRAGVGTARRLCYTGDLISAEEALSLGVIDKILPNDSFHADIDAFATTIASKAPIAVQATKKVIRESQEASLLSGLRLEVEAFLKTFASRDREEGMQAFIDKRTPKFTGR